MKNFFLKSEKGDKKEQGGLKKSQGAGLFPFSLFSSFFFLPSFPLSPPHSGPLITHIFLPRSGERKRGGRSGGRLPPPPPPVRRRAALPPEEGRRGRRGREGAGAPSWRVARSGVARSGVEWSGAERSVIVVIVIVFVIIVIVFFPGATGKSSLIHLEKFNFQFNLI